MSKDKVVEIMNDWYVAMEKNKIYLINIWIPKQVNLQHSGIHYQIAKRHIVKKGDRK